jgi:hypothetical protein
MIGAVVAPLVLASPPLNLPPQEQFSVVEDGGGLGLEFDNVTAFSAVHHGQTTIWFVERNTRESNWCGRKAEGRCISTSISSHDWIDGRSCPPLGQLVLQLPRIRAEERGAAHPRVSDTPLLSLVTFSDGGMATERLSEYVGPLATWWWSFQEQLKPCWTKTRPTDL